MTLLPGWGPRVPAELGIPRTLPAARSTRGPFRTRRGAGLPWPRAPGIPRRPEARVAPTRTAGRERTWTLCRGSERKCSFFFTQRGVWGLKGILHGKKWPVWRTFSRRAETTRNPTAFLLAYHEKNDFLAAVQMLPPELRRGTPQPHPNPCSCGSWIIR